MKRKIINLFKVLAITAMAFTSNSCEDLLNDPLKDKKTGEDVTLLLVDPDFFDTKITVNLVDTAGNTFDDKKVYIAFLGEKASNIVDLQGVKNKYYTTTNGTLEVAVDPNIDISESNPFSFQVIIGIEDYSWYAFPHDVELLKEGYADVVVTMLPFSSLKSANLSQGDDPFDLKFNGVLLSSANGWRVSTYTPRYDPLGNIWGSSRYYNGNKVYCSNLVYSGSIAGNLTADNLTIDEGLISEYGIYQPILTPENNSIFVTSVNVSAARTSGSDDILGGIIDIFPFSNPTYYTGYIRKYMEKCTSGININVVEKYGQKGTAKFNYTLSRRVTSYTWANEHYSEVQQGKLGGESFPFDVNTGSFYYPTDIPADYIFGGLHSGLYYDNGIYLSISGEGQYNIEPSLIKIDGDFCGKTVNVTAVPKSGLKPYRIVAKLACVNNPVGALPTVSGTFKEIGTTDQPSSFSFSGGKAILQLKPNKSYSINANGYGQNVPFDFPTDPAQISSLVSSTLKKYPELKSLNISFSEITTATAEDPFLGTQINIDVTMTEGNCPLNNEIINGPIIVGGID